MVKWAELVQERNEWVAHNFPNPTMPNPGESILGVMEEIGELTHAHLKQLQGIRGTDEEHEHNAIDAIGDITVYLLGVMNAYNILPDPTWIPKWKDERPVDAAQALFLIAYCGGQIARGYANRTHQGSYMDPLVYYLRCYCKFRHWDYDTIVTNTWEQVKQRDWQVNRDDGTPRKKAPSAGPHHHANDSFGAGIQ
jgi:hypothetical protein